MWVCVYVGTELRSIVVQPCVCDCVCVWERDRVTHPCFCCAVGENAFELKREQELCHSERWIFSVCYSVVHNISPSHAYPHKFNWHRDEKERVRGMKMKKKRKQMESVQQAAVHWARLNVREMILRLYLLNPSRFSGLTSLRLIQSTLTEIREIKIIGKS